ncbi:hypothetical protein NIES4106_62490 (plasmid) [Fischerella sp. NIES-4106]|nr:hypothetical protein NIES4106_62490 [Fischerella sp. NIES-4106]
MPEERGIFYRCIRNNFVNHFHDNNLLHQRISLQSISYTKELGINLFACHQLPFPVDELFEGSSFIIFTTHGWDVWLNDYQFQWCHKKSNKKLKINAIAESILAHEIGHFISAQINPCLYTGKHSEAMADLCAVKFGLHRLHCSESDFWAVRGLWIH